MSYRYVPRRRVPTFGSSKLQWQPTCVIGTHIFALWRCAAAPLPYYAMPMRCVTMRVSQDSVRFSQGRLGPGAVPRRHAAAAQFDRSQL
jgi:hypothetical protein